MWFKEFNMDIFSYIKKSSPRGKSHLVPSLLAQRALAERSSTTLTKQLSKDGYWAPASELLFRATSDLPSKWAVYYLSAQFACKWCLMNIILEACLTLSTSLPSFLIMMPSGGVRFHHREQAAPAGLAIHLTCALLFTRNGKIHWGWTFACPFRDTGAYSM